MANETSFVDEVTEKSLFDDGFIDLHDSGVGEHISELERKGFPYFTEYGLDFCKTEVLDNQRLRSILHTYFKRRCTLGHWLRYKAEPAIECFIRGGRKAGQCALAVHLLAKGSAIEYWPGSHLHDFPTTKNGRSMYETSEAALQDACLRLRSEQFNNGGMVVRDARLRLKITKGYVITLIFATDQLVAGWPKMILPKSTALEEKVSTMQSQDVGVNFAFHDSHVVGQTDQDAE